MKNKPEDPKKISNPNCETKPRKIRRFSLKRSKQDDIDIDQVRISRTLKFIGADIKCIDAIEVYTFLQDTPLLVRPKGGWWSSPSFIPLDYNAFNRIDDENCDDYLIPPPQAPGVGLSGALWAYSDIDGNQRKTSFTSFSHVAMTISRHSMARSWRKSSDLPSIIVDKVTGIEDNLNNLIWRDIHTLNLDPDQPTFERLEVLEKAGFSKIAGVRFDICGEKGIVVYFAKDDTSVLGLSSHESVTYLKNAATMIGSSVALTKSRKALIKMTVPQENSDTFSESYSSISVGGSKALYKIYLYGRKFLGVNLQPPPAMSFLESFLSFFGAFVTLLSITGLSKLIQNASDGKYTFILGPFGALMTLQYSLVMAPASQPRNIIFGQTVAICVSMSFSYVPIHVLPIWIKSSLATASTIGIISKLGIIHPPAGATSLIVASGEFDWMILPLMLVGNLLSIIIATLVNNLSEKRQYPTNTYLLRECVKTPEKGKLEPSIPSSDSSLDFDLEKSTASETSDT